MPCIYPQKQLKTFLTFISLRFHFCAGPYHFVETQFNLSWTLVLWTRFVNAVRLVDTCPCNVLLAKYRFFFLFTKPLKARAWFTELCIPKPWAQPPLSTLWTRRKARCLLRKQQGCVRQNVRKVHRQNDLPMKRRSTNWLPPLLYSDARQLQRSCWTLKKAKSDKHRNLQFHARKINRPLIMTARSSKLQTSYPSCPKKCR